MFKICGWVGVAVWLKLDTRIFTVNGESRFKHIYSTCTGFHRVFLEIMTMIYNSSWKRVSHDIKSKGFFYMLNLLVWKVFLVLLLFCCSDSLIFAHWTKFFNILNISFRSALGLVYWMEVQNLLFNLVKTGTYLVCCWALRSSTDCVLLLRYFSGILTPYGYPGVAIRNSVDPYLFFFISLICNLCDSCDNLLMS